MTTKYTRMMLIVACSLLSFPMIGMNNNGNENNNLLVISEPKTEINFLENCVRQKYLNTREGREQLNTIVEKHNSRAKKKILA